MNEIKFSKYVETGEYVTELDLDDFIRLFVNHRPVFGLDTKRIEWAFEKLGISPGEGQQPAVDRADLLDILQTHGEFTAQRNSVLLTRFHRQIHCLVDFNLNKTKTPDMNVTCM